MSLRRVMMAGAGGSLPDPYWANVAALLHMDGANGSTTFTDETGKTWTANAGAAISTSQSKFGGASGDFRASAWITTPSHADFGFGSGDFTIEGFNFYTTTGGGDQCVFDNRSGANTGIAIYIAGSGGNTLLRAFSNAAQIATSSPAGFSLSTWEHWAVTRQGTTLRGFIGGTQVFSVTDSRTYASSAAPFIGDNYVAPSQSALTRVDEVRITKGVARYTANFTPPTAAFPNS